MRSIEDLLAISTNRKGGVDAVFEGFEDPQTSAQIAKMPNDRWLAEMTRAIFQAGFNWKVVDRMWPGFEAAFQGFQPGWCANIEDERFDALVTNTSIVRHGPKIRAVCDNANFVQSIGGFGAWVAAFGPERFGELLLALKSDGSRLGGTTGQYFLRAMGVDGWILSRDVVARLTAEGVVDKVTPSKATYLSVQSAFSEWHGQSGYSLKKISRILATSIG
ncbi:MAG: DNA-3-methyladenine glycosylase I [Pseudomonadota bacterium]